MNHFSLSLEPSKWSLKRKNKIRITLKNKGVLVDMPYQGIIGSVGIENIKAVTLVYSNNELYLSFKYDKEALYSEYENVDINTELSYNYQKKI